MKKRIEKPNKKRIEKLRDKYRLIIYNDNSFEEVFSYRLNRLNVVSLFGFVSITLAILVYFGIAYTPLKEYLIPDYPKLEEREKIIENELRTDSLETLFLQYAQKQSVFSSILNGEEPPQYVQEINDSGQAKPNVSFERSVFDSLLRSEIQEEDAFSISQQESFTNATPIAGTYFVPPVKGVVSSKFSEEENHFGTDIVSTKENLVRSVMSGTVIIDSWTLETGYIIGVQHDNNFVTFYKHNSKLLKQTGDRVQAGEGIAIIGNTGEITTGPHLHFELWHNGKPVNSEDYIVY